MNVYIDIETIPDQRTGARQAYIDAVRPPANYSKPETIDKWLAENREQIGDEQWRKTALNGGYGEIVCVCFAVDGGEVLAFKRAPDEPESVLLDEYGAALDHARGPMGGKRKPCFVGHNVEFDLRFLMHRHFVRGIRPAVALPYNDAPWKGSYFDTMHAWAGARDRIKLTDLASILGYPAGNDINGSQVWDAVRDGRLDDVVAHCAADVERTRYVHRRLTFEIVATLDEALF